MTLEQVYMYWGGSWRNAMIALNMSPVAYVPWRKRGSIPFRSQLRIEKATNGALKAKYKDDFHAVQRGKALRYVQKQSATVMCLKDK